MGTPVSHPPHPHPGSLSHLGYGEECDYICHHDVFSIGQLVMFRNFWDKRKESFGVAQLKSFITVMEGAQQCPVSAKTSTR